MNTIKAFAFCVAITGIAFFSGCNREMDAPETVPETGLHEVVFHAGWADETKTVLQEDGSVWWEPGDSIMVVALRNTSEGTIGNIYAFVSTNTETASSADFIGNVDQMFHDAEAYVAIYPYCSAISASLNHMWSNLPTIQTAIAGNFDRRAFISLAVADSDNNLFFKNLCGGVKFSVSQEGIKEVSFKYSGGEYMTGQLEAEFNNEVIQSTWGSGSSEVIVRATGNSYFEVGKYYYAVMNPLDSDYPLIVTYKTDSSKATYITEGPTSIKRSVFKRLYNKDAKLTFVPRKDEAIMMSTMSGVDYSFREQVTEVYFHPSSSHTTDVNLGTEDAPVYFEIDGTVVHYYTPKEVFNIKNVSSHMFYEWRSLTKVDFSGVDASEATDFSFFFGACFNLKSINWGNFDTSSAVNMYCMFHATGLDVLDLSSFNTSRVVNMERMFAWSRRLEELNLYTFETSHVVNLSSAFEGCRNLRTLNLSSFNTSNCADMSYLFNYCVSLEKLDLANFNVSAVQNASMMSHNMTIHRKHCFIRASEATKSLLCGLYSDMPQAAKDYFITWIAPGEDFPIIEDPFADLYKSTDYSKDMTYSCIQEATKGKGLDLVIMGDAYSDRLINDGTYDIDLTNAVNQIFSEEPLKSMRDYFNIYLTYVVSENETIAGVTALDLVFEDFSSHISGGDGIVDDYMMATLPNYGREWTTGRPVPFIILLANTNIHAGTCAWFSSGSSLVYTTLGVDEADFHAIQCHEFGHAIGLLADEYDEHGYTFDNAQSFIQSSSQGWWPNVDVTNDPYTIKWSRFLQDERYANQGLGIFEGGFAQYAYGIWRPTENSIMGSAPTGFNAPCREAIYKRVHELADDSFEYDYETFVAFDQPSWAGAPKPSSVIRPDGRTMKKLPPPVFVKGVKNPNGASTTIHN